MRRPTRPLAAGFLPILLLACSATPEPDEEEAGPPTCREAAVVDETFVLSPGAGPTQVLAQAAFDGSIWLTYLLPNEAGNFDVMLARLECDGRVAAGPIRLNDGDANTGSPQVAISGDGVLVAWHADTGESPVNLSLRHRLVDRGTAEPVGEERRLRTFRGAEEAGNTWMPALASRPEGGFVLAGARGVGTGGFQVFAVLLDEAGERVGEAIDAHAAVETQVDPAVAVTSDGAIHLAWTVMGDADVVYHTRVPPGASAPEPAAPIRAVRSATSSTASLAADRDDPERVHLAVTAGSSDAYVWLVAADRMDPDAPHSVFGEAGRTEFMPTVAAGPEGNGAVAWYRNRSGIRNDVRLARLARSGRYYDAVGEIQTLQIDAPAAPYPLTLIHLEAERYFVAWSEGQSPELFLRGRIVDLE